MIDIHSHIIYGVDDGAKTLEESCEMLRVASQHGTTDIVATPHASVEFPFDERAVQARLAELREAAGQTIRIHSGSDFHLTYDNIQDAMHRPSKYTVNGQCYLMVEFSDLVIFRTTDQVFEEFLSRGIIPVVTHPERNPLLRQRLEQLRTWVQRGVLMQLTAQSLTGFWGSQAQAFTVKLLEEGMAHVFASDAHDPERRPPILTDAFEEVADRYGRDYAVQLFEEIPRAVIEGMPLKPTLIKRAARRAWYKFW